MADSEQRKAAARASDAPAAESGDALAPRPGTVGALLKQARVAQDLSIEQLAAELRIEAPQLAALEQDRFDRIGVPVFVKGYIKQYGTRLGLDNGDLLAAYYKQGKLEDIDIRPMRAIKVGAEQRVRGWVVALLVLLAIVAGLVVWWLNGADLGSLVAPPAERSGSVPVPAAGLPATASPAAADVQRVEVELPAPAPEPSAEPAVAGPGDAEQLAAPAPGAATPPDARTAPQLDQQ